ncbi:aldehyde dehydrogenase [Aureimonas jatrophae]|uniref:Acyl-CoA reductase n=1 Tax=Aureimonas jatrophae TaxID=1166073 RepID=A0A1H0EZA8_9HYPH|nr:aldehyde dehydrogenase [Aureimonas jatrophae]MBB3950250.1 acyl-CoA reductase-like NAD-dependent aldehyde dehydrogenase [Aureimonas jatrophae]SDN87639.1 Acyl-CoA reductase [Aureimonas jatrophae]
MDISLIIAGRDEAAAGGATFEREDPVTGAVATRAASARKADVDRAVEAAAQAFPAWSRTGPTERRLILNRAADLLETKTARFIEVARAETGATSPWIGFNVMLGARILREAASMTTQIKGEVVPSDKPGTLSLAFRQPVGVLVGMAPWNAPVILAVRAFAMPLACGNTVVLKASETCPHTHRMIVETLHEAGLPAGVLNLVTHAAADAPEVVEALVAHPRVKRINFTGSTRVGRIIAMEAAKHLKPVLLELGGKAPLVVLDDADLEAAVNAAAFGAFLNQGQICMSTERIIVDERVADRFVELFAAKAATLPFGDPREPVVLGAVVSRRAAEAVGELVEDAVRAGARVVAGGEGAGTILPATVVDGVTPQMRLFREESFGPVVCVVRARDADHAVELANDTEYGLSAAVFGRDVSRAMEVARRIESGICHINGPTVGDEAQMPFGGTKASGYGRFGGTAAIAEFTELRWITVEDPNQHYPF